MRDRQITIPRIDITDPSAAPVDDLIPGHRARSTTWRWFIHGKQGILLPAVRVGKKLYSTPAAVNAWLHAVTEAERASMRARQGFQDDEGETLPRADLAACEAELAAEGI